MRASSHGSSVNNGGSVDYQIADPGSHIPAAVFFHRGRKDIWKSILGQARASPRSLSGTGATAFRSPEQKFRICCYAAESWRGNNGLGPRGRSAALWYGSYQGCLTVVQLLAVAWADDDKPDRTDNEGRTPLLAIATKERTKVGASHRKKSSNRRCSRYASFF